MKLFAFFYALLNRWVIIGAFVLGCLFFSLTVSVLVFGRPEEHSVNPATAVLVVIPAPTSTPVPKTPTLPIAELTPSPVSNASGGALAVGKLARVTGTGGDGLRVRDKAGLNGIIKFLAEEGEEFEIQDGPEKQDDYIWWLLVSTGNAERRGWAVSDFLSAVP